VVDLVLVVAPYAVLKVLLLVVISVFQRESAVKRVLVVAPPRCASVVAFGFWLWLRHAVVESFLVVAPLRSVL